MDLVAHFGRGSAFARAPRRVASVLSSRFQSQPALKRRLIAAGYLGLALGTGFWAERVSTELALESWRRGNLPESTTWDLLLRSKGFTEVRDPDRVHRVLRSLPATTDQPGTVWTDAAFCRVVVFGRLEENPAARVYRCLALRDSQLVTQPLPEWRPAEAGGAGWGAFESVAREVESRYRAWRAPVSAENPRMSPQPDPREVRY